MTISQIRESMLLWIVALYWVLGAGFMQLRIPPGGAGVPLGEVVLILSLLTINHSQTAPQFSRTIFVWPFLVWWGYCIGKAMFAFPEYGFWALRDATHPIESLFLYVGFAFGMRVEAIERYWRWVPVILTLVAIHSMGFPIDETLQAFSPSVQAAAGYSSSILFNYVGYYTFVMLSICYVMLFGVQKSAVKSFMLAGGMLFAVVVIYHYRTLYLQIIMMIILFGFLRPGAFGKSTVIVLLGITGLALAPALGVEFQTQFAGGQSFSLEFITKHFASSFGYSAQGVESSASGYQLRLIWWADLYSRITASLDNIIFGLGYGFPLVNFAGHEAEVREPHNSFISTVSRAGLIGLSAYLLMFLILFLRVFKALRVVRRMQWKAGQGRLILVVMFTAFLWINAFTEDAMEKPFFAIPLYFMWGVTLAFIRQIDLGAYVRSKEPAFTAAEGAGRPS